MSDCERFGVALEQRLREALPASEAGPLDAHLDACSDCRDYHSRARRVEAELAVQLARPARGSGWPELHARLRSHRRARIALWVMSLFFLAAAPLAALGLIGESGPERLVIAVLGPILSASFGWLSVREGREVQGAATAPGGLFEWARRRARVERWMALGAACFFFAFAAVVGGVMILLAREAEQRGMMGIAALLHIVFAVLSLRLFLRARRELEALT